MCPHLGFVHTQFFFSFFTDAIMMRVAVNLIMFV